MIIVTYILGNDNVPSILIFAKNYKKYWYLSFNTNLRFIMIIITFADNELTMLWLLLQLDISQVRICKKETRKLQTTVIC